MSLLQHKFEQLHCCVLIPTYNNASKLAAVLDDVLLYTHSVLLVNDGSNDRTKEIISNYPSINSFHLPKNKGKGNALLFGLKKAHEMGYDYAISIDSDGQHLAKDLALFLEKLEQKPGCFIVGARNMKSETIPGGSSFGHRFSNFWFEVETGKRLPDTQSGFRLYPVHAITQRRFFTTRYEFEIESLVRLSWAGIEMEWVPIEVLYPEDRITHFRKFWDFFRISLLNTVLVLIALLWIKPRDLYKSIRNGEAKRIILEQILGTHESNARMAIAIGFGFFMGIFPVWGFQMLLAVFFAALFRLNKAIVLVAANISIPPIIPLFLYISYAIGAIVLQKDMKLEFGQKFNFASVQDDLVQYYVGAVVFAILTGLIGGLISYLLLISFRKNRSKEQTANH